MVMMVGRRQRPTRKLAEVLGEGVGRRGVVALACLLAADRVLVLSGERGVVTGHIDLFLQLARLVIGRGLLMKCRRWNAFSI